MRVDVGIDPYRQEWGALMTVDRELMLKLEALSAIALDEEEREAMRGELQSAVDGFDRLRALDTEGVEPLTHVFPLMNVTREDRVVPSMPNEELLANAKREKGGAFMVHRAVE